MTTRRDVMLGGAALAAASAVPAFAAASSNDPRPKSPLGIAQTALGHYFRKQRGDAPGVRGPAGGGCSWPPRAFLRAPGDRCGGEVRA